jgi:hypothetical protein
VACCLATDDGSTGAHRPSRVRSRGNLTTSIIPHSWPGDRLGSNDRVPEDADPLQELLGHKSRLRRTGIVALARKLLIEFWTYLEAGAIPEGATTS